MSVRFLLDTNICIYIAKRHPPEVARRFEDLRPGDVGMSIITYGELLFGAEKSQHPQPAKERLQRFVWRTTNSQRYAKRYPLRRLG